MRNRLLIPTIYSFLFLLFHTAVLKQIKGQDIIGVPIIENFTKSDYNASTQNWSICQGSEGYMYFGNNQGVLQYTGYSWELIEMSNYSIVRCVISVGKDSILVGAFNELGLLNHDNTGRPVFQSWNEKIPEEYRNYGEIWRIHKNGNLIFFQSFKSILIFKDNEFYKAISPDNEYRFSYLIDKTLFVYERSKGLLSIEIEKPEIIKGGEFFKDKEVWSIFKLNETQLLVGTQYNGLYVLENGRIKVWETQANQFVTKHTLFSAQKINNNLFAFGTVSNGLIITDEKGNITQSVNNQKGLQDNTVLSLCVDNLKNIWLGLDNGIDYIKVNSPLSFVRKKGGFGTGYSSIIYKNSLYAGTNQGLFKLNLKKNDGNTLKTDDFEIIPNTAGQVWGLFNLNGNLLCAHNNGLYLIQNNSAKLIFDNSGVWNICPIPNEKNLFVMGTYYGFYLIRENNNNFDIINKIAGLEESARRFFFDSNGYLWMSHGYKAIYQILLSSDYKSTSKVIIHNSTSDLPMDYNNDAVLVRNKVIATTEKGIYEFDYQRNKFIYDPKWDAFFNGNASHLNRIIESSNKKIWAFKRGSIQLLTLLNDKIYDLNTKSFLLINNTLSGSYENVLSLNREHYLIGTEDGFVLYNDSLGQSETEKIPLSLAWVESISNSTPYNQSERIPMLDQNKNNLGEISFRKRFLKFNLSMPFFSSQNLVKFRYRINGETWSNWINGNILDLNELRDNNYTIDIECTIDEKETSGKTSVSFKIKPPIHRSWYAYLVYLLLFTGLSYASYILLRNRLNHEKRKAYLIQRKKMIRQGIELKHKAQEAENELNILKNEKLQTDIIYKSKELANITMDIIQKNMVLGDIKETLQDLVRENPFLKESNKINHLIRKINKGLEQKDKWIVFEKNFDQVHENFLHRLKELHPELTSKDMRLAAYLRMNLASKEIAPLMNISVRSLEISRYRLRKKLKIDREHNLYDYLMNI